MFFQNSNAQSNVDSVRIQSHKLQLNLFFTDSNQYKFQIQDLTRDSIFSIDTVLAILTMDSAVSVIYKSIENLKQSHSITYNYVVLYILNMSFQMEEMRSLFEKLSELGIRVKVEFLTKK